MIKDKLQKRVGGNLEDFFPQTMTDCVKDQDTGASLDKILKAFNMLWLEKLDPANGVDEHISAIRNLIPPSARHKGLFLSYIDHNGNMVMEYYAKDNTCDNEWHRDENWRSFANVSSVGSTEWKQLVEDVKESVEGYRWYFRGVQEDEQRFTVYMSHDANIMTSDDISGIDKEFVGSLKNKFYVAKYFDSQSAYNSGRAEYAAEGSMVAYKGASGKYMLCGFDIATSSWVELGNIDEIKAVDVLKANNGVTTINANMYDNESVPTVMNVYAFLQSWIERIFDGKIESKDGFIPTCGDVKSYLWRHSTVDSSERSNYKFEHSEIEKENLTNYIAITKKGLEKWSNINTNRSENGAAYGDEDNNGDLDPTRDDVVPTDKVVADYVKEQIGLTEKKIERLKLSTGNTTLLARYLIQDYAHERPIWETQSIVYEFFSPKEEYNKAGNITVANHEHSTGNYWFGYKPGVYQDEYFQGFILRILPAVETQMLVGNTYHVCHQDKTTGKDSYANVFLKSVGPDTIGVPDINKGPNSFYIDVYGINYPHYTPLDSTPV